MQLTINKLLLKLTANNSFIRSNLRCFPRKGSIYKENFKAVGIKRLQQALKL